MECFPDDHGKFTSNLIPIKTNLCKLTFFEFQRKLFQSIGSANDIVIKPIKKPIAIKNAISKQLVLNVKQTQATHSYKSFLPQVVVIFQQVFF